MPRIPITKKYNRAKSKDQLIIFLQHLPPSPLKYILLIQDLQQCYLHTGFNGTYIHIRVNNFTRADRLPN